MITCHRIVQQRRASDAFRGEGARLYGGRWNSKGTAMVYTAASISLAMLEMLVHLESHQILQAKYCCIEVNVAEEYCTALDQSALPSGWDGDPAINETRQMGDAWARAATSAVLAVPSAVTRSEANYLLNPGHPDFRSAVIGPPKAIVFDRRLVKS